jgi:hypothetical protein
MRSERFHRIEQLVKEHNWTHGVELGVWKGRTSEHLMANCPNLHLIGIDAWQDGVCSYEKPCWDHRSHRREVEYNLKPYMNRYTMIQGITWEVADQIENESQDFVFVDADHDEKSVTKDIDAYMPKIKKGGWIMGHDYDWPGVKAAVDKIFPGVKTTTNSIWYHIV